MNKEMDGMPFKTKTKSSKEMSGRKWEIEKIYSDGENKVFLWDISLVFHVGNGIELFINFRMNFEGMECRCENNLEYKFENNEKTCFIK